MDSPPARLSLGPVEISIRRGDDPPRIGFAGSLLVHVIVAALLMVLAPRHPSAVTPLVARPPEEPVSITFVPPTPPSEPRVQEMVAKHPPPPVQKPLRMAEAQKAAETARPLRKETRNEPGRNDDRAAGGEAGGPLTAPTPGSPQQESTADVAELRDTKDLSGRLRDFRRAVERPLTVPEGPKGGGRGAGGLTMPDLPATGFGFGNLEFEGRDYDWENYGRQIHGIIWRAWHLRLLDTSGNFERWASERQRWLLEHANGVRFTILRSGKVVDVAIETRSGCYPLDDSATDTLNAVILPPLPDDFQRDREVVHARFIAEGSIRTMKAYLQSLHDAGVF
ncbi:MAG TPA: hypothetical protein VFB67_00555 [Candidatus Polarisedimenticolaceae bacterium]|nr:hypothetical protein [Candidatus Polarisedimenticolaceae bacterium]